MKLYNSRGKLKPERNNPKALRENSDCSFLGCCILGMGFTLTPTERDELVRANPHNEGRIFPYLGGQEVNTSPTQSPHRYVINFEQMSLEEVGRWPDLLSIVREKVKPERDAQKDKGGKKDWWQFLRPRVEMREAIRPLPRCLVTARVTKHLMFSFQPTDRVFADSLYVYPLPAATHFAILQSRIHEPWVWLLSSTMGNTLRYAASDCFDTFPFPCPDPHTTLEPLESVSQRLYNARADFMLTANIGLTKTYNAMKDLTVADPRIVKLRALHEEMDREVLRAYGWGDLVATVPPFGVESEQWNDEVTERLFELNAQRQ